MADPMRIRAQAAGDKATIRVLMSHEMESGQRKDGTGKIIPAWHIQDVTATLNGKVVMTAEWGPAVSKNPFLQFTIKGAKAGDKVGALTKLPFRNDPERSGDTNEENNFCFRAHRLVCRCVRPKVVDRQHRGIPRHVARRQPCRIV
jgi:sulfur-oxidizing protein SoxZ